MLAARQRCGPSPRDACADGGLACCLPAPTPRPERQNSASSTEKGRTKEGADGGLELDELALGRLRMRVPLLELGLNGVREGSGSPAKEREVSPPAASRNSLGPLGPLGSTFSR